MLNYIKTDFAPEILSGVFEITDDTDAIFMAMGMRFPIRMNRIAWEQISPKEHIEVRPLGSGALTGRELEDKLASFSDAVSAWFNRNGIAVDATVYWVGDDTNGVLRMTLNSMMQYFPQLFSFGQHSYVAPENGDWCLNYVMEGEMFFAMAPKSSEPPLVNPQGQT